MELAKVARGEEANEQSSQSKRNHVSYRPRIENAHMPDQQIGHDRVEEPPNNIDGCRRKTLAWRFGKGTLKGASHAACDEVRDRIGCKNAPEEIRHQPKPIHMQSS